MFLVSVCVCLCLFVCSLYFLSFILRVPCSYFLILVQLRLSTLDIDWIFYLKFNVQGHDGDPMLFHVAAPPV